MAFVPPTSTSILSYSQRSSFLTPLFHPTYSFVPSSRPSILPILSSTANETSVPKSDASERKAPAPPPSTFYQAVTQAQGAVEAAIEAGYKLLEVEFPPLPTSQLESSAVGAYDVFDANVRLAVDFAKKYAAEGKRVVIAFPDLVEKDRAVEMNNEMDEPVENVRFGCIKDAKVGAFIERLWTNPEVEVAVREDDDIFVVLGASCQELPDVERLVKKVEEKNGVVVLFNLKLDTSRGDLGLPAFPRKDLHYRFLSKVLPVYYLRTRTYSRSISKKPYIVNYSGALYRVYPGQWQVLLDVAGGDYNRLKTLEERPALGEVRDILTDGLGMDEMKGDTPFMYKGYKSKTWWEEDRTKQVSNVWRA